jgi:hypothetical protein
MRVARLIGDRRLVGAALAVLVSCLGLLLGPAAANAAKVVESFFPASGSIGTQGGQFNTPRDIAVNDPAVDDPRDGWVYVVDSDNNRIQAFERNSGTGAHEFRWAIGRDVISASAAVDTDLGDVFEKCTTAADCKAGSTGTAGDGPGGEFNGAKSIAIDQQTGHFYVRERNPNLRIQEFTADGVFVRAFGWNVIRAGAATNIDLGDTFEVCTISADCQAATTTGGAQAGQFGSVQPGTPEVDNGIGVIPAGSPNAGNVIASDTQNLRLMEFDPDAPTVGGAFVRAWGWGVDTGASRFEICTAATTCQGGNVSVLADNGAFNFPQPRDLAVDSRGVVYTGDRPAVGAVRVMRFNAAIPGDSDGPGSVAAQMLLPVVGQSVLPSTLEVDPDGDGVGTGDIDRLLFGVGSEGIREYDISSTTLPAPLLDTHMVGAGLSPNAIGVNPSAVPGGLLYVTDSQAGAHRVYVLDDNGYDIPPSVVLDPVAPGDVTPDSAELSGSVDPNGFPVGYRIEYREVGAVAWTPFGSEQSAGSGDSPVPINTVLTGLSSNTQYEARIMVRRGFGNGIVYSAVVQFTTEALGPVVITHPPSQRACTSAALAAEVNSNGSATSYFFEYGTTTAYGSQVPVPAGQLSASGQAVQVSEQVQGLQPGTTYHYRVVASNAEGDDTGLDVEFTTRTDCQPSPGGRGYELVSPTDDVSGIGDGTSLPGDLAATPPGVPSRSGERYLVRTVYGPTLLDGEFAYANDYAFAERTPTGWVSHSPFTRPNYGYAGNRFAVAETASDALSLFTWRTNGGRIAFFPEMEEWDPEITPVHIGDWQGRYEVFAPTDDTQGTPEIGANRFAWVSANGNVVVMNAPTPQDFSGLTGPDDPFLDRLSTARAVYVDDVSAGLSDTFPGEGVREPVGVCDAGTVLPERIEPTPGTFAQDGRPCPEVGGLTSSGGASLLGDPAERALSETNQVSADGSRIFFHSPDPAIDPAACSGVGAATSCPTQLFVRHDGAGGVATRWISRSAVAGQAASLMAAAYFEGATPDGDKVAFRTPAPLTPDDPNGSCGAPCLTGTPDPQSWDLFVYDFTDSGADDPGAGTLTRVSAGPDGDGDGNVQPGGVGGALRFMSNDGARIHFTSAAPLPGVPASSNGTITAPAGTRGTTNATNLYVYDAHRSPGDRYRFVARIPRATADDTVAACASTANQPGQALDVTGNRDGLVEGVFNCFRGSADGALVTLMTGGRLTAGDPDAASVDVYAYDVTTDELTRVSAPQGGIATSYPCVTHHVEIPLPTPVRCWGDGGIGYGSPALPVLGVSTNPTGDKSVFFQSKSRLIEGDTDDEYDVYEWRGGELTLLTPGTSTGAYYTGNSSDGQDIFVMTRDRLTWQDSDAVMDTYDIRRGGGFAQPAPPPPACQILPTGCQGPGSAPVPVFDSPTGGGNATPGARVRLTLAKPSRAIRRAAARTGVLRIRVRVGGAARVVATATAKMSGRQRAAGRGTRRFAKQGAGTLRLKLNRAARRQLAAGKAVRLSIGLTANEGRPRSMTVTLKRGAR